MNIGDLEQITRAKEILNSQATSIRQTSHRIGREFCHAVESIMAAKGALIVMGIGKAGLIGRKISATFTSTGTTSHFIHPSEAMHGDLGRLSSGDVVLMLSNSGETEELKRVIPFIRNRAGVLIALTSNAESSLAKQADHVLLIDYQRESCKHNLAPTNSTTTMLSYGDALAIIVSEKRGFAADDFAKLHPGGSLGIRLMRVDDAMRPLTHCRIACCKDTIRSILTERRAIGRRSGAIMLTNESGRLCGIFTDSDLARLLERRDEDKLDEPIEKSMSTEFIAIESGAKLSDAIEVLGNRKISELPVIDFSYNPVGMIDITDVMELISGSNTNNLVSHNTSISSQSPILPASIHKYS